jgi:6-phosphofructokinase 1
MKRIGILTSGGDAPGMNAVIRSMVRVGRDRGWTVFGIMRGYQGLILGQLEELDSRSVSNIIHRGGTILKTSRSKEFETSTGQEKAKEVLKRNKMDGLILIGGDGTLCGAVDLDQIWEGKMVGIPGTIDNDLYGTDFIIGYDTAVNTALEAIDKIRDTVEAHERCFLIEVMGRHSGSIALAVGIGGVLKKFFFPNLLRILRVFVIGCTQGK